MSGPPKVWPLAQEQAPAVDPRDSVWLSASAGTGKTQVLSARVLRLLLQGDVAPSQVLCLTFTKAGAAEMATRINEVLATWVRADAVALAADLKAIGASFDPDTQDLARTLFAKVLDCPGGGLRIDTIHAFSQWLLANFPHEAGLSPGMRPMEDRNRDLLQTEVLSQLLLDAEAMGDPDGLLGALAELSVRLGPDDAQVWLMRCASAREAWFGPGSWQPPLRPRVCQLLGLPVDACEGTLTALCDSPEFDLTALEACLRAYTGWATQTGTKTAAIIAAWLGSDCAGRLETLDELTGALFTKDGRIKNHSRLAPHEVGFEDCAERLSESIGRVRELRCLLQLAEWLAPALTLGRAFALAWDAAKRREGLIDFDDQIRLAAEVLGRSESAEWIRYKLDRRFDHILVDEAQDTNEGQWQIIYKLTEDFFAGLGAQDDKLRTIFVVGDYKQAIFRFQGTSPENFETARARFKAAMQGAADNVRGIRSNLEPRELQDLGLGRSFRTAQNVLDFVDQAISHISPENFGLNEAPPPHVGEERPGCVAFWRPVGLKNGDEEDPTGDDGEEGWLPKSDRVLADTIARQVGAWMDDGFPLVKGGARRARPGDVMILVRKRKELAGLIVARLYAAGVPVAGVDRLRLGAPLAVRDLIAALRFAAQPFDDLNLACLLVSPLIGWNQEALLEHGYRPDKVPLWEHLRRSRDPAAAATVTQLLEVLALADRTPPQALVHWLLTGPWQGRRKVVARLGREAHDPIDELLNAAHAYAAGGTPSLLGFLQWFDAGEGELKREAGAAGDRVRVMTVHGSKGLQAPIVILADAAGNPKASRGAPLGLADPYDGSRSIPLPPLRKEDRLGRIREAEERAAREEIQEHWRLLYVAMTRAEEALFITGSLGAREKEPAEDSWYARLASMFTPDRWVEDPVWGSRIEVGEMARAAPADTGAPSAATAIPTSPSWLTAAIGPEPRPPRPLAPSGLGDENTPDPPLPPGAGQMAARRGVLIHKLLERLPDVEPSNRAVAAARWLDRTAGDIPGADRAEIAEAALGVLSDNQWAEIFGLGSLAEAPVAALVGERVIAGTIDRLLVARSHIRIVDFKTARRPPASLDQVPLAYLRQMGAYAAALESAYPGRAVEAALLYTQTPRLIVIPADVLDAHKRALRVPEQSF